ncbi:amidase family protein, partial [Acinetobacter baumannii]
ARIHRLDPLLDSVVHLDAEAARQGARCAERAIRAGDRLGALNGVPVGIKDVIDVAGMPTTCHSKILAGNRPDRDAAVTRRLRE